MGTACGFVVSHPASQGQSRLFFTPGVPFEFKQMVREQIMPRLKGAGGEATDTELRRFYTFGISESAPRDRLMRPLALRHRAGYCSSMPLIELKLIGHGASAADMDAAEARACWGDLRPGWWDGATRRRPARSWPLGARPLHLREGESRGALLAMCHFHPGLEAHFSHSLPADLMQLAVPAAPLSLTIGRAGPDGVPCCCASTGGSWPDPQRSATRIPRAGAGSSPSPPSDMLRRHLQGLPVLADYLTLTRTARRQG